MVVATFFPDTSPAASIAGMEMPASGNDFHHISELVKNSVEVIDAVGLYVAIGAVGTTAKGATRAFTAGLGWAAAHALVTTFVPFIVEARTAGFQWSFVQTALGANLDFVFYVSLSVLIWTFQRLDLSPVVRNFIGFVIASCVLRNVIYQFFAHKLNLHSWNLLGAEATFVALLLLSTIFAFSQIGNTYATGSTNEANSTNALLVVCYEDFMKF